MWQDPIIKETLELRNKYAAQFNYDLDAISEDIKKRQEKSTRRRVSFSCGTAIKRADKQGKIGWRAVSLEAAST